MTETLLPTTVVGSYPQPDWLIDREKLTHLPPVRVRAGELWRVPEPWLEAAQDDATRLAIRDMQRAGINIITDGEIRRESYSNRFDRALEGILGPTALHLCFGYAYVARDKPNRYAFLPQLTASKVEQISIEAAQPNLDLATLDGLAD